MGKRSAVLSRSTVLLITGAAALGGAPAALGAEVNDGGSPGGSTLFFAAGANEVNNLRVTQGETTVLFDDAVPIADNSTSCVAEGDNVRCTVRDALGQTIFGLFATLGDRDDSTTMAGVLLFTQQQGETGNDTLRGSAIRSDLSGDDGNDTLIGGTPPPGGSAALDFSSGSNMVGGPGADRYESNNPSDTVDYRGRTAALSVTLDGVADDGEAGEGDNVLPGIDTVVAGSGNDRLIGGAGDESLIGRQGNDVVEGLGGDDTASGNAGDDSLRGGDGSDRLDGGPGRDEMFGGGGIDSAELSDEFPGGDGAPTIRDQSVTLDDVANDGAAGEGDNVGADVEDVQTASGNDTVNGNDAINFLSGRRGNDTITGGGGSDSLAGNDGDDTINARDGFADRVDCGAGVDRAVVDQLDDVARCETVDRATVPNAQDVPDVPEDAPPTVSFITPAQDAKLGGTSNVTATASDDRGIAAVVLIDDGRVVGQDTTAPYSIPYTPTGDDVGRNTLVLTAIDTARQTATAVRPVRVDRFTPTGLTTRIAPKRDAQIPYRFTTSGTLTLPSNVTRAQGCSGQVAIQIKAGKKTISNRRAKLSGSCAYRSAVRFTVRDRVRRGTLNVTVRYLGNDVLLPLRGRRQSVRVG